MKLEIIQGINFTIDTDTQTQTYIKLIYLALVFNTLRLVPVSGDLQSIAPFSCSGSVLQIAPPSHLHSVFPKNKLKDVLLSRV